MEKHGIDFHQIVFCQVTVYDGRKREPSILLSKKEGCFVWVDYSWRRRGHDSLGTLVRHLASQNNLRVPLVELAKTLPKTGYQPLTMEPTVSETPYSDLNSTGCDAVKNRLD